MYSEELIWYFVITGEEDNSFDRVTECMSKQDKLYGLNHIESQGIVYSE